MALPSAAIKKVTARDPVPTTFCCRVARMRQPNERALTAAAASGHTRAARVAGTSYQEPEVRSGRTIKSHLGIIACVETAAAVASAWPGPARRLPTCLPATDAKRKSWQRKQHQWRHRATPYYSALSHRAATCRFYTPSSCTMRVTADANVLACVAVIIWRIDDLKWKYNWEIQ